MAELIITMLLITSLLKIGVPLKWFIVKDMAGNIKAKPTLQKRQLQIWVSIR
jgi:hypothetical protein